jgi:Formylmethanofuran dehydrogenase subunit B
MAAEIADLHIPVGISGVEVPGIVYRMDNVPIQYRKVIDMPEGMLSDEEVLTGIANRLEELILEKAKKYCLDSSESISSESVICT